MARGQVHPHFQPHGPFHPVSPLGSRPFEWLSACLRVASSPQRPCWSIATPPLVIDSLQNEDSHDLSVCVCVCFEELCCEHIFTKCQARFTIYLMEIIRSCVGIMLWPFFGFWDFLHLPFDVRAARTVEALFSVHLIYFPKGA